MELAKAAVVIVLDAETDAGYQLARTLLADGCRVAAIARHPGDVVRIMHGHSSDQVIAIAANPADHRQWSRVTDRVVGRFGRIDTVMRAGDSALRASA